MCVSVCVVSWGSLLFVFGLNSNSSSLHYDKYCTSSREEILRAKQQMNSFCDITVSFLISPLVLMGAA